MSEQEYHAEDDWDDYPGGEPSKRHEICDRCGYQMWWDEAGTAWRCDHCETQYE